MVAGLGIVEEVELLAADGASAAEQEPDALTLGMLEMGMGVFAILADDHPRHQR